MGYLYGKGRTDEEIYLQLSSRPNRPGKFSKYKGITKGATKKYRACFKHQGIAYNLGEFDDEIEAVKAYNRSLLRVVGPYARIHPLPDDEQLNSNSGT